MFLLILGIRLHHQYQYQFRIEQICECDTDFEEEKYSKSYKNATRMQCTKSERKKSYECTVIVFRWRLSMNVIFIGYVFFSSVQNVFCAENIASLERIGWGKKWHCLAWSQWSVIASIMRINILTIKILQSIRYFIVIALCSSKYLVISHYSVAYLIETILSTLWYFELGQVFVMI